MRARNGLIGCWTLIVLVLAGCGESPGDEIVGPDPAITPFVGTWDAEQFVVTNTADTTFVADLLISGSFFINVQPSGLYTATLVFGGLTPFVEIGQLEVEAGFVTMNSQDVDPCPGASEYTFVADDRLELLGPTCFDFNLDGETEEAEAFIELVRR